MNNTVILVNEWADFELKHPGANIDDFCRHRLISTGKQAQKNAGLLTGGVIPPISAGLLLKVIGRIHKLNMNYQNKALEGTGLKQVEELGILLSIQQEKNPRKTDVIYANLFELSSGSDMMKRLEERLLIREYTDKNDKRSKRIELTLAGEKVIELCMLKVAKVAQMITNDLTEDDKLLCIQLLKGIEMKFSALWQQHRRKTIDEVYKNQLLPETSKSNTGTK